VDAFLTRDITSAKPWEKVTAVQGGLLVARPDKGEKLCFGKCVTNTTDEKFIQYNINMIVLLSN